MKSGFGILEEEPELIKWVEKEEGRRLKTKYFSLNMTNKYWKNEIDIYINSTTFLEHLIQFSEEYGVNLNHNHVKTFAITEANRFIYEDFEKKLLELSKELESVGTTQNTKSQTVKIHTHVSVPIDDILEEIIKKLKD